MEIVIHKSLIEDQIAALMYAFGHVHDDEDVKVSFSTKTIKGTEDFVPITLKISKREVNPKDIEKKA